MRSFCLLLIAVFCIKQKEEPTHLMDSILNQSSCQASSCHSTSPLAEFPPSGGSHALHLQHVLMDQTNSICLNCHWNYNENPLHRNGIREKFDATGVQIGNPGIVFFGGRLTASGQPVRAEYNNRLAVCSSISCHGNTGGLNWYNTKRNCRNCHIPGSLLDPDPLGSHSRHTNDSGYECTICHYGYSKRENHMNGVRDNATTLSVMVSFDPRSLATRLGRDTNNPAYDGVHRICNDVYCHSDGTSSQSNGFIDGIQICYDNGPYHFCPNVPPTFSGPPAVPPVWGGNINCGDCHAGADPPTDRVLHFPNSGRHRMTYNEHTDADRDLTDPYTTSQCFWCHSTDNTENFQGTYNTRYHLDGQVYFHPEDFSNGGTIWSATSYGYLGAVGHCGEIAKCWNRPW